MKCPQCIDDGVTSRVTNNGSISHLLGWQPFYDEAGEYHAHDPNRVMTDLSCSNGHRFSATFKMRCPNVDCDYGSAEPVIEKVKPWPN